MVSAEVVAAASAVVDRVVLMARNNTDNDEDRLLRVLFALPVAYKLPPRPERRLIL